jgi:predicted TIM-barrel enzyme
MKITSTFLPPQSSELAVHNGQTIVMAFDTVVDQKSYVVGITVGTLNGPNLADARVSAAGLTIVDRCSAHHLQNYPQGSVFIAGVANITNAEERVRKVLAQVPPDSFVLLLCSNNEVYDAAFPALCVDLQSTNMNPH